MGTFEVRKVKGGRFESAELGWFKQRKWYSHDADAEVPGMGAMVFTRKGWTPAYRAENPQGLVLGEHVRSDWMHGRGPLVWRGVEYEFVRRSGWTGSFALTRYDEELATFVPQAFGKSVTVESAAGAAVPTGLLLFGAWVTLVTQRETAAAS